jgi:hypothetical protein
MQLATTIVALASVGETDPEKLKHFAIRGLRGALGRRCNATDTAGLGFAVTGCKKPPQ